MDICFKPLANNNEQTPHGAAVGQACEGGQRLELWNVEPAVAVEPDMAASGMGSWNVKAAVAAEPPMAAMGISPWNVEAVVAIKFSLDVDEAISLLDVGEAIFWLDVDVLSGWRLVTKAMGGWRLESKVMSRWTLKSCAGADDTAMMRGSLPRTSRTRSFGYDDCYSREPKTSSE